MSNIPRHPIGVVARRTGLKPDLIRAWERRYGAVEPGRSTTRRRFYSDADIQRLLLLRRVVGTGRGIGQVAGLSNPELEELIAQEPGRPETPAQAPAQAPGIASLASSPSGDNAEPFLTLCLSAAQRLDVRDLELQLERGSVALSRPQLMEKLLVPLMHRIGELWQEGTLRPVHEHMTSAVVRSFLGGMRSAAGTEATAPHLISTTPPRQLHELGALIAAATASSEGWQITYLGPDLPAEEIAAAALQKASRVVALSLTYPPDDPLLMDELRRLRRLLPQGTELVVGGRATAGYQALLHEIGARIVKDMEELRRELRSLRTGPMPGPAEEESPPP